jgi:fused signal recognition particle receptor
VAGILASRRLQRQASPPRLTLTATNPDNPPATGFLARLRARLNKGRAWLQGDLRTLFGARLDAPTLEAIEDQLISADVGVSATEFLLEALRRDRGDPPATVLKTAMLELLRPVEASCDTSTHRPFVTLVVGVNGTGKTTTLGKLAERYRGEGKSVLLAAGDTFRAAAVEQLKVWGQRTGAMVIAQAPGADPAAVAHDALTAAAARGVDIVLIDTAGRLHTAAGLMDELKKIRRVIARCNASAPHETLLVLDASQGQNALRQARTFHEALRLTGLVITKLDGTAKGGIVLAIARELGVPIRYIGVGEGAADLQPFLAEEFVAALLGEPPE